jgi:methionine aminotransferase
MSDERDIEFVKRLTRDNGVAAIPVSVFYRHNIDNSVIRFCFAKEEETLNGQPSSYRAFKLNRGPLVPGIY